MVEVDVNKDIRKNETKFVGNLTLRQTIAVAIAASYSLPIFFGLSFIDLGARLVITFCLAIPTAMCGWIKPFGMPFEFFIARFLYLTVLTPAKRKVRQSNFYKKDYERLLRKEENAKIRKMSDQKRKKYMNDKKKPIKRSSKKQYKVYT